MKMVKPWSMVLVALGIAGFLTPTRGQQDRPTIARRGPLTAGQLAELGLVQVTDIETLRCLLLYNEFMQTPKYVSIVEIVEPHPIPTEKLPEGMEIPEEASAGQGGIYVRHVINLRWIEILDEAARLGCDWATSVEQALSNTIEVTMPAIQQQMKKEMKRK